MQFKTVKFRWEKSVFVCDSCGYEPPMNAYLKEHTKIHSDGIHIAVTNVNMKVKILWQFIWIPSHCCVSQCDYKITMSCHLKCHEGIHSDGKHIVNQCDYETPINAALKLHGEERRNSIDVSKRNLSLCVLSRCKYRLIQTFPSKYRPKIGSKMWFGPDLDLSPVFRT